MNALLTIFLAYGLLTVLYRLAIRPLLKSVIVERMEQREQDLMALAKVGHLPTDDFRYQFLMKHCTIRERLEDCSISDFIHFLFSNQVPKNLFDDLKRFQKEATPEMQGIHDNLCKDMALWLTINSPFHFAFTTGVIVMTILLRGMNESLVKQRAQVFVSAEACGCAA